MNKKYLFIGLTVLVAASLAWVARAAYRAHKNLVTIDVYNAPLAEVIKSLQRQTRETILAGSGLDTKVTLALKNVSLDEALDRLGQAAGANWSKWHAVHGSERALNQLEAALRERTKLADAGWTNLAPPEVADGADGPMMLGGPDGHPPGELPPGAKSVIVTRGGPAVVRLNRDDVKNGDVEAAVREKLKAAGADDSVVEQAGAAVRQSVDVDVQATGPGNKMMVKAGGPRERMRVITRSSDGKGHVTEEIWSPEHVVLEERLHAKLGDEKYEEASEAVAREVAKKVKAQMTTLYVLRKSPGGFPFGGRMMRQIHLNPGNGTNAVPGDMPQPPDIEGVVRRAEAENYTRLTPEQRVQRAREKQAAKPNQP